MGTVISVVYFRTAAQEIDMEISWHLIEFRSKDASNSQSKDTMYVGGNL